MICVDTNLLVYAHRALVPEHRAAQRALDRAAQDRRGWGIALASVAEFWSVVTHPASAGRPATPQQAQAFLETLIRSENLVVWTPAPGFWQRLARLASANGVLGGHVFDLQIALAAVENGATEVWTHDKNFVTVPGLSVHDPLS